MNSLHSTPNQVPPIRYEADSVLTGLRIGNAILHAIYGPPLSERDVPDPLPCSRTLQLVKKGAA